MTCDVNSSADTSVPAETFTDEPFPDYSTNITDLGGGFDGNFGFTVGFGGGSQDNPEDTLDDQSPGPGPTITGTPLVGSELSYNPGCAGAYIEWRLVDDATGAYTIVSSGVAATYIIASEAAAAGKSIVGVGKCPDPSSPTGYGPEVQSTPIIARTFVPGFENVTFTGSYSPTGLTTITRTGVWKGYLANPPTCTLYETSANGSSNHSNGVTGMRIEKLDLTSCNGYNVFRPQARNKNGVWENAGSISGVGGFYAFEGSFSFSTTAPDAVSAENLKYE